MGFVVLFYDYALFLILNSIPEEIKESGKMSDKRSKIIFNFLNS